MIPSQRVQNAANRIRNELSPSTYDDFDRLCQIIESETDVGRLERIANKISVHAGKLDLLLEQVRGLTQMTVGLTSWSDATANNVILKVADLFTIQELNDLSFLKDLYNQRQGP